jgi:hypothetical protein
MYPHDDGAYNAPAYCALCDRPIATGPLCDQCAMPDDDEDDEDTSDLAYEGGWAE